MAVRLARMLVRGGPLGRCDGRHQRARGGIGWVGRTGADLEVETKTGEVEDDPSSDSGEGNGKKVQHGCGDRASSISHHSRSITIAQTAPTTQKRRTIYFLQRYRRKESMDMKSNGLMVQQ
eukprot:scaffold2790_cov143-Skeletonema_marinoi.AAC.5